MTSLYKLTNEYRELENMDLDAETLADTLESLEGEFDAKADAICHVLANLQAMEVSSAKEVARLLVRSKGFGDRQDKLKDYLRESMEKLGKKKIESAKFTINCVAGRDKVNVLDESEISTMYFTIIPETEKLDKKMLLEELKKGDVKGAELIKSKSSLRIK
jgi:tRNA G10  N-methylase Trm11